MALSEFEKKRIEKICTIYCEGKIPPEIRDQLKIQFQIRGDEVILFETRPAWNDPSRGTFENRYITNAKIHATREL
jgi:hypothetical protein